MPKLEAKIKEYINTLPPLPDSVHSINQVVNDPESSLADLAKEIKKDPVASTRILSEARSAYYGFKNITTIEKAVSQFGREISKAIAIDSIAKSSFNVDISCYGINNSDFLNISQKRNTLMMKWFSRVDFKSLKYLAISSLIGNIGQIVIADLIKSEKKEQDFKDAINAAIEQEDVLEIEKEFLGVDNIDVTSLILENWKFDEQIVDIIKKSKREIVINSKEVENFDRNILANFVVYNVIDSVNKNKLHEIDDDIRFILNHHSLNYDLIKSAIDYIRD
jgi:HD-like signal output (HDOD) protein